MARVVLAGDTILGGEGANAGAATPLRDRYISGHNTHLCDIGSHISSLPAGGPNAPALPPVPPFGTGIMASVSGVVEVTESVVSVVPAACPRYMPQVGDIIIGKVISVGSSGRWLLNINTSTSGVLPLSNLSDPSGVLRRRGRQDELLMRKILKENDLVVTEVQRVHYGHNAGAGAAATAGSIGGTAAADDSSLATTNSSIGAQGAVILHVRNSDRFGVINQRLGQLVTVSPALVPRSKHQFFVIVDNGLTGFVAEGGEHAGAQELDGVGLSKDCAGVSVIVGLNGNIWIGAATREQVLKRRQELEDLVADGSRDGGDRREGGDTASISEPKDDKIEGSVKVPYEVLEARRLSPFHIISNTVQSGTESSRLAHIRMHVHRNVSLVASIIKVLAAKRIVITQKTIEAALSLSYLAGYAVHEILYKPDCGNAIAAAILQQGSPLIKNVDDASTIKNNIIGRKRERHD